MMIYSIKGSLEAQLDDAIVVQTNGIGYLIHCTTKTMQEYHISDDISLIIYYHVREDAHVLYGFNSTEERTFFEQLISVSGIGPKVAMGILSSMPMPDLVAAIANENAMLITQCPGIGKKTASRLIIELKDKVQTIGEIKPTVNASDTQGIMQQDSDDVALALRQLGYQKDEIKRGFMKHAKELAKTDDIEEQIKLLLKYL
jgi:Holliday junction DNA helicase RuvA